MTTLVLAEMVEKQLNINTEEDRVRFDVFIDRTENMIVSTGSMILDALADVCYETTEDEIQAFYLSWVFSDL